jgi:tetratricopeptide (TPR) repeat protein
VSARRRIQLIVALAAAGAAGATVAVTALYDDPAGDASGAREGAPPVLLDLGLRRDAEARALRGAAELYDRGRREEAGAVFDRYRSLQARVGSVLARWPRSSTRRLEALAREHPRNALVRLHVGLARFWEGNDRGAVAAWQEARRVQPDSLSAVRAGDLLHPEFFRGLPTFVPGFPVSAADARGSGQRALIARGIVAQRLGKPISAQRAYDAATAAPGSHRLEAQVAAAVARFDKADPSAAFGRLGPLSRAHPRAAVVRYHLGLLLLWSGQVRPAREQLRKAIAGEPGSPHAWEAKRLLTRLENVK